METSDATLGEYYFSCSGNQVVTLDFGREISSAFSITLWFRPKEPPGGEEENSSQWLFVMEDLNDWYTYLGIIYNFWDNYIEIGQSLFGGGVSRRRILEEAPSISHSNNS